ncbi:MAG TPA: VOC family protein [Candidatus Limnocylindria bacterium]|nr:VOC family protein [Candidatus Limnocylindria bacterium]
MQEPTAHGARFGHVNVIARDWRLLADFYTTVFGCELVPPERDYAGEVLARGTAVPDASLRGVHLRLPGNGADGPTLEIYTYGANEVRANPGAANREGWGHIAFAVDDVNQAREAVLAAGGGQHGEIVTTQTADGRRVTWAYLTDPEGNLLELQSWSGPDG